MLPQRTDGQTLMFLVLAPGDAVPALFEAGYNGLAAPGGPADDNVKGAQLDLLTVAFQEVGHSLGMSSGYPGNIVLNMGMPVSGAAADGLWQFDPDWLAKHFGQWRDTVWHLPSVAWKSHRAFHDRSGIRSISSSQNSRLA